MTIFTPARPDFLLEVPLGAAGVEEAVCADTFSDSLFRDWEGGAIGKEGKGRAGIFLSLVPTGRASRGAEPIADDVVGACRGPPLPKAAVAAMGFGGSDGCVGKDEDVEADAPPMFPGRAEAPPSCRSFASIRAILASVLSEEASVRFRQRQGKKASSETLCAHMCTHTRRAWLSPGESGSEVRWDLRIGSPCARALQQTQRGRLPYFADGPPVLRPRARRARGRIEGRLARVRDNKLPAAEKLVVGMRERFFGILRTNKQE